MKLEKLLTSKMATPLDEAAYNDAHSDALTASIKARQTGSSADHKHAADLHRVAHKLASSDFAQRAHAFAAKEHDRSASSMKESTDLDEAVTPESAAADAVTKLHTNKRNVDHTVGSIMSTSSFGKQAHYDAVHRALEHEVASGRAIKTQDSFGNPRYKSARMKESEDLDEAVTPEEAHALLKKHGVSPTDSYFQHSSETVDKVKEDGKKLGIKHNASSKASGKSEGRHVFDRLASLASKHCSNEYDKD